MTFPTKIFTSALVGVLALALPSSCSESDDSAAATADEEKIVREEGIRTEEMAEEATPVDAAAGPAIMFDKTTHDFGKITVGDVKGFAFVFANTGDQPLLISEVRTSCGCTTAGQWTREVAPGESGRIPIQLDSTRFDGLLRKAITVVSNAVSSEVSTLHVEANVWSPVKVQPRYAGFGMLPGRESRETKVVTIRNREGEPLTLSGLTCTGKQFEANLETVEAGKEFKVVISTVPPLSFGLNRGDVTLKTSNVLMPEIRLAVHANVQSPVLVSPLRIALPEGKLPAATSRIVTVRGQPGKNLTLSEPIVDLEGIRVQLKTIRASEQFQLVVSFPKGFQVPTEGGATLSASTNDPEMPTIEVPITNSEPPQNALAGNSLANEAGTSNPAALPIAEAVPQESGPQPDIRFEAIVHDFGEVTAGKILPAEFRFTNEGKGTLKITAVNLSCGCTTAGEWDRETGPGEQGKIPIALDTKKFRGPLHKTVSVISNDPDQRATVLTVKAQIWNPVQVAPQFAAFGVVHDATQPSSKTIRIVNHEKEPLVLSEPKIDNPVFKAALKTIRPGREFQLVVETSTALVTGSNRGTVTIETSSSSIPPLSIIAHATLVGPLTYAPTSIILPQRKVAGPITRYVILRNHLDKKMAIKVADKQPAGISAALQEIRPGIQYRLELKFPAGFEVPAGGDLAVTLETDQPDHAVLSIPVVTANGEKRAEKAGASP